MLGLGDRRVKRVKDGLKYSDSLIRDERLRSDVRSAADHGSVAARRVRKVSGIGGLAEQLVSDQKLRGSLRALLDDLDSVGQRVRRPASHTLRNILLVAGGSGAVIAAVPSVRRWATKRLSLLCQTPAATVEQTVEVEVPVSTAYKGGEEQSRVSPVSSPVSSRAKPT